MGVRLSCDIEAQTAEIKIYKMSQSIFFLLLIIAALAVVEINGAPDSSGRDVHTKIKDAQKSSSPAPLTDSDARDVHRKIKNGSPAPFTVSFINVIMTFIFARIMA